MRKFTENGKASFRKHSRITIEIAKDILPGGIGQVWIRVTPALALFLLGFGGRFHRGGFACLVPFWGRSDFPVYGLIWLMFGCRRMEKRPAGNGMQFHFPIWHGF